MSRPSPGAPATTPRFLPLKVDAAAERRLPRAELNDSCPPNLVQR
jgi:hypothetical protein